MFGLWPLASPRGMGFAIACLLVLVPWAPRVSRRALLPLRPHYYPFPKVNMQVGKGEEEN